MTDHDINDNVISADELAAAGEALHGDRWQAPLARDLGVNTQWVQRAMANKAIIRAGHVSDLISLLTARRQAIDAMLKRLSRF